MKTRKSLVLADALSAEIASGSFPAGSRLPSVRVLARERGCSVSTAVEALDELVGRGRVRAVPRSGFYVRAAVGDRPAARRGATSLDVVRSRSHGLVRRILEMGQVEGLAPFHAAIPSPSLLPLDALRRHLRRLLDDPDRSLGGYTPSAGSLALRTVLARGPLRRIPSITGDGIVVVNGCMEALALALEATTSPGDVVAIESPTFFGLIALLESLERRVVEIPVDLERGIRVDLLRSALERHPAKALVVSPDVQNPTGARLELEARRTVVRICRDAGVALIEDAVFASTVHDGADLPSLAELHPEGTILCSSASKTFAPGLRTGWMVPGRWTEHVLERKSRRTLGGPAAPQDALAAFLDSEGGTRHLRRMRSLLRQTTSRSRAILAEAVPAGTRISDPQGGFFLWLEVPRLDALEFYETALEHRIGVLPGPVFSAHQRFRDCLRISCGTPLTPKLEDDLRRIGALLRTATKT